MLVNWKTQHGKVVNSTKTDLSFYTIPVKIPEGFFCSYRQANLKFYIDKQKNKKN